MSSRSMQQNYIQEPSYSVQYAPDRKSPCPQCCQTHEPRVYHQAVAQSECRRPHSSTCDCNYNPAMCSRQQPCCPSVSERAGSVIQPCNCPGLVSGFGGQTCSCIQQQQQRQQRHQNTLASMTPYLHSPYPVLPVHHIAPGAVSFSPIPISGAVAFPQVVSAAHGQPEIIPNRMEETYYQRHMANASNALEDSSHYHTHIHHHIHRYQHYPLSCVSIGHHNLSAMAVQETHPNQSRHHWRHLSSRAAAAPYPYVHLPFHYHPYRVIPTSSIQRNATPAAFFSVRTVELEEDDAGLDWNNQEGQSAEPRGLTKLEVEQLPSYVFKGESEDSSENTRCVVCICDFEKDETLRILPCSHEFHSRCVDKWLKSNPTCPICRAVVHVPL